MIITSIKALTTQIGYYMGPVTKSHVVLCLSYIDSMMWKNLVLLHLKLQIKEEIKLNEKVDWQIVRLFIEW